MNATVAPARANRPLSRCERLLELLASRSQAHELWTNRALGAQLYCSERTVERSREWLRTTGRYPVEIASPSAPAVHWPLRREGLLHLLMGRTQAHAAWSHLQLAAELCCSERTVERDLEWLRDTGRLPIKLAVEAPRAPGNWSLG
jgi:predicted DNA-binding transcriptional regulator YafY